MLSAQAVARNFTACLTGDDGRGAGRSRFVIATYNIENYTVTDRMTSDGYRQNYPKPEVEKTALRAVIHALRSR